MDAQPRICTGKLEIELLVGQHYRLGILADLASFPFPFVLPGTIEASGLESQVKAKLADIHG